MSRFFRIVEKKRGRRRTGSNWLGGVGEAVFCAALFLLGTLLLSVIVGMQLAQPRPEQFALGVGGWLLVLVTASSVVLGGGGLIFTVLKVGTSVERRSALARRAVESDLVHSAVPHAREYPTLPGFEGLTDSPGIELAYRLPSSQTPGWQLLATTIFTMLWNFVVCLLTVSVASGHVAGRHEWLLTALLVPCWAVCYWSIRKFLQLLVLNSGMAQTTVEVSELPLMPGQAYQVVVAQHGQATMRLLELAVVCEEEATFTQGTDIRTEVRTVYRRAHLERRDFTLEPGRPFTAGVNVDIPPAAMHSFQSPHNAVRWKLVVRGEPDGWPAFERGFPVVVYPGDATRQVELGSHVTRHALKVPAASVAAAVAPAGSAVGAHA